MSDVKYIILAWELHQKGVLIQNIANHCERHRSTVSHWLSRIESVGLNAYIQKYLSAKKGPHISRQLQPKVKREIIFLRNKKHNLSGYSIHKELQKKGISVSVSKIYEILRDIE